jgi:hypothetical protein
VDVRDLPVLASADLFEVREEATPEHHHPQERADPVVVDAALDQLPLPAPLGQLVHLEGALVVDESVVRDQEQHLAERETLVRLLGVVHRFVVRQRKVASANCDLAHVNCVDEVTESDEIDPPKRERVPIVEVVDERRRIVLLALAAVRSTEQARQRPFLAVDLELKNAMEPLLDIAPVQARQRDEQRLTQSERGNSHRGICPRLAAGCNRSVRHQSWPTRA